MNLYAETVSDFGRRLGLASLAPSQSGGVELTIERIGILQMEEAEDCVLVTLAREWPQYASRAAQSALALCHWRESHPWPISAGAKGEEWLSFTARVPLSGFDVPALESLVDRLAKLHDAVERAG